MNTEKKKSFLVGFAYTAVWVFLVYIIFKYLLGVLLPFVIGFAGASLLAPLIRKLSKKLSLSRRFVSFVCVLVFYATIGTLLAVISIKLFVKAGELFSLLPSFYSETVSPLLSKAFDFVNGILVRFDNTLSSEYGSVFADFELSISSAISALSVKAVSYISGVLGNLPMFLLEIALAVISTFFFSADYNRVTQFILSPLPENTRQKLTSSKKCLGEVMLKYLRSYLLIMLVTFGELSLGLTLAGIKNPLYAAFVITLLDILPVLGTGLVLIPWGLLKILASDFKTGIILLSVYAIITVVRNIIEPKIVGKEVGLHPALTLISMFVGTRLFGVTGLFALPVGLSLLKNLSDCHIITLPGKRKS